jgi:hypothetical protein
MTSYKFNIGQVVDFDSKIALTLRTRGPYEVIKILPSDAAPQQTYRIRSQIEPFERVAMEYELVAVDEADVSAKPANPADTTLKSLALAIPRRRARAPSREISLAFGQPKTTV